VGFSDIDVDVKSYLIYKEASHPNNVPGVAILRTKDSLFIEFPILK
jgi:hypothetical protein